MRERDEAQGARRAEAETVQKVRRGFEHRATQRFARVAIYSAFPLARIKKGSQSPCYSSPNSLHEIHS